MAMVNGVDIEEREDRPLLISHGEIFREFEEWRRTNQVTESIVNFTWQRRGGIQVNSERAERGVKVIGQASCVCASPWFVKVAHR
jgi:hypothetical protein